VSSVHRIPEISHFTIAMANMQAEGECSVVTLAHAPLG
jgi:hypothetical protein